MTARNSLIPEKARGHRPRLQETFGYSAVIKMSFASASSRAEGVMMVFFPTTILDFACTAARTSSSHTNPTGFDSVFSALAFGGSSCVYDESGGAAAGVVGVGAGMMSREDDVIRPPGHCSPICSFFA